MNCLKSKKESELLPLTLFLDFKQNKNANDFIISIFNTAKHLIL